MGCFLGGTCDTRMNCQRLGSGAFSEQVNCFIYDIRNGITHKLKLMETNFEVTQCSVMFEALVCNGVYVATVVSIVFWLVKVCRVSEETVPS